MAISDKTNFIKDSLNECGEKADLDVPQLAVAVMRHIAQLVSNAHAITQLMASDVGERNSILVSNIYLLSFILVYARYGGVRMPYLCIFVLAFMSDTYAVTQLLASDSCEGNSFLVFSVHLFIHYFML